ncbi:MAG: DNA-formamidopyrimidine glycosylase family protein [Actinomycetota bacterium]|nr:DNA-formamidopyrimidine glycosylase family protein [Actinomycetota bacterium]
MTLGLELPEIETIRRDLDREISGRKIKSADAASMALLAGYKNRKSFTSQLVGRKVRAVRRLGLHLLLDLDDKNLLVVRLGAGALLLRNSNKDVVVKGTELTVSFTVGGQVRLVDPEGASEVRLVLAEDLFGEFPSFIDLGLDPIGEPVSWTSFAAEVLARQADLKAVLADDSLVVGLGDIYADEVLFHAGLRHDRQSDSLSIQEVRRLYRAVVETVHEAVKYRGTSLEERPFTDVFGVPGDFAQHLAVYGREGQLSPRSRAPILRTKYKGRWTYYCGTQV